jgi:hypothetical protein
MRHFARHAGESSMTSPEALASGATNGPAVRPRNGSDMQTAKTLHGARWRSTHRHAARFRVLAILVALTCAAATLVADDRRWGEAMRRLRLESPRHAPA